MKLEVADEGAIYPVTIDPTFTQQQKLEPSDPAAGDRFANEVAISGDTVVIGNKFDDGAAGGDQGSVYVFVRSGGVWTQQQKLLASDPAAGAVFGHWVAIDGETLVVGTPGDFFSGSLGSAYVFVRSGGVWSQQQKLQASDAAANDQFGLRVAISGETVAVSSEGAAYVFVRSGGVWSQQQKLLASDPEAGDRFGEALAISAETVVVGARMHDGAAGGNQGSAYVFVRSSGVWTQQQKLEASDAAANDQFGGAAAIDGETLVVGAQFDDGAAGIDPGSAYVFVRSGWSLDPAAKARGLGPGGN